MYKAFVEGIDRYKVEFGTTEVKPKKDHDDPMGLHAMVEGEQKGKESAKGSG